LGGLVTNLRPESRVENLKPIDKALYGLARSIPGKSFWESVNLGRVVIAATVAAWPGELMAMWVLITGRPIPLYLYGRELELWLYLLVVFVVIVRLTPSTAELEQLSVPLKQINRWKRNAWWVVAGTYIVVPLTLVLWSTAQHGGLL
jgi:hypothetical protein